MPAYSLYDPALYRDRCVPHAVFYYDKVWKGYHMDFHTHPHVEIMYAVAGHCAVYCREGEEERRYAMEAGSYILIDAEIPHRLEVEEGQACSMKNIEFVFAAAGPAQMSMGQLRQASEDLQALLRRRKCVVTGRDRQGDLLRAFDSLLTFYLYSLEKPHAKAVSDHAFSLLLLTIAYLQAQEGVGGAVHLRRALGYIHAHCAEPLKVEEVAAAAGVHPVYLQRLFRKNLNRTIVEYLTAQRVERAAYLLRHTSQRAADIARETGFGSRQQFYRAFLSLKGVSPKEYRSGRPE